MACGLVGNGRYWEAVCKKDLVAHHQNMRDYNDYEANE